MTIGSAAWTIPATVRESAQTSAFAVLEHETSSLFLSVFMKRTGVLSAWPNKGSLRAAQRQMLRESEKRLVFCLLERSGSREQALCQSGKGTQGRCWARMANGWR